MPLRIKEQDLKDAILDTIESACHEWDKHHQGRTHLFLRALPNGQYDFFQLSSYGEPLYFTIDYGLEVYCTEFRDLLHDEDFDDHFHPADFNFQYQTWQDMPEDELEEAIYKWRMNAIVDHLYTVRTEFLNDIVDLIAIRHDIELESEG